MAKRSRTKKQPPPTLVPVEPGTGGSDMVIQHATGTQEPALQQRLIKQVVDTLWLPDGLRDDERITLVQSAISMLQGIKPTDEMEGMLATQMVATHNAAMECLRRAMIQAQSVQGRDHNLKHASKLLSLYARQIEVLNRHRGKGQQKVTVEYVNVEAGGQAVVGHIETGDRNRAPGTRDGNRDRAIPHEPGEEFAREESDGGAETGRRKRRGKS